jgi:hypothetical protein
MNAYSACVNREQAMAYVQCDRGHFYDNEVSTTCPTCGVPMDTIGETQGMPPSRPGSVGQAEPSGKTVRADRTRPAGSPRPGGVAADSHPQTVAIWEDRLGGDPVVGWLVCVEGPDKGRDFRIHTERNNIGRDAKQQRGGIIIPGDGSISGAKHAVISYNPKNHRFNLIPGDGRGITYLNDEELLTAQPLSAYDRIEMGKTTLIFVPFCGERFTWPVADD